MKRALVTGATGFLGRAIVDRLAIDGWHVVRAVRRSMGCLLPPDIELGPGPWNVETFTSAIAVAKPDVVFHLAGTVGPVRSAEMYAVNTVLAANLLDAVSAATLKPAVVLIGSAAEYGNVMAEHLPVQEDGPCHPISDYGISKYAQTLLGIARARVGAAVLVARIFNPLGVGMPVSLALANFADQLKCGSGRLLVGDLDIERDFISVAEAARLTVSLASDRRNFGQVYNICSGGAVPLRMLVDALIKLNGLPVEVIVDQQRLRPGEMRVLYGATDRLRAAGLKPKLPDFAKLLAEVLAA